MNELDLDKIYVGALDILTRVPYKDEIEKSSRTKKTALLYKNSDSTRKFCYIDLETGVLISQTTDDLRPGNYFVNFSKYFVRFSDFLETFGVKLDDNKITKNEALSLFKEKIEIIYEDIRLKRMEKTLAIIKPDAMNNIDKIIDIFYENGFKITDYKIKFLDEDLIKEHYCHLLDKPFFPKLRDYMMSAPVAIMVLERKNAVEKLRNLMGPTDSTKASPDTIRGKFGTDVTYNAIHGSDSKENAEIEIKRFFKHKQKRI